MIYGWQLTGRRGSWEAALLAPVLQPSCRLPSLQWQLSDAQC